MFVLNHMAFIKLQENLQFYRRLDRPNILFLLCSKKCALRILMGRTKISSLCPRSALDVPYILTSDKKFHLMFNNNFSVSVKLFRHFLKYLISS